MVHTNNREQVQAMLNKLTEHVFYKPHFQETDRPVLGLITGEKFSLVVDAGNSPAHAKEFLESTASMAIAPLAFLALTHWHWDHVFGTGTMKLMTISHSDTKKKIDYLNTLKWDDQSLDRRVETGEEIEFCSEMIKREMPDREELRLKSPEITFAKRVDVDLGNLTCIIEHVGSVHAMDSSIVYIPEEKVMFLGDCLAPDIYSGEQSYDREELQHLVDKISQYEVDFYLTSHYEPETHGEIWTYIKLMQDIGDIVGTELSAEKVRAKFQQEKSREPDEEETELLTYFVNGNRKRKENAEKPSL